MNANSLSGIDCLNRLLKFVSWSISLHLVLTTNLLIPHTVLPVALLIPPDPFFLPVIPHFLNILMLRSAMIPLIWVKSNYACLAIPALQVFTAPSLVLYANDIFKSPKVAALLFDYNTFLYTL